MLPFYNPQQNQKKPGFPMFSGGYKQWALDWNGLKRYCLKKIQYKEDLQFFQQLKWNYASNFYITMLSMVQFD